MIRYQLRSKFPTPIAGSVTPAGQENDSPMIQAMSQRLQFGCLRYLNRIPRSGLAVQQPLRIVSNVFSMLKNGLFYLFLNIQI